MEIVEVQNGHREMLQDLLIIGRFEGDITSTADVVVKGYFKCTNLIVYGNTDEKVIVSQVAYTGYNLDTISKTTKEGSRVYKLLILLCF